MDENARLKYEQERKKKNLALKVVIPILTAIIVVSAIVILSHHAELQPTGIIGNGPFAVSVNPLTHMTYVSNSASRTVSVIDGKTNTVKDTIQVGTSPEGISVNPSTNIAYVANLGD